MDGHRSRAATFIVVESPPAPLRRRDRRRATKTSRKPWIFLRNLWDHPVGKWITGIFTVAAVLVPLSIGLNSASSPNAGPTPTALNSSPQETSSPDREPRVGDCLRHDGAITVEPFADDYGFSMSEPEGPLSELAIADCSGPHELEIFPSRTDVSNCAWDAIDRGIGTWDWSTRLIGGEVSPGLCAVGLRSGIRLQTVEGSFADVPEPMLTLGACSPGLRDHSYESVPNLYIPCKPGSYLHYSVTAISADVANGVCEYYADAVHEGQSWGSTAPSETDGRFWINCLYQLPGD